jgi:lysophospholipase L1-like esterase
MKMLSRFFYGFILLNSLVACSDEPDKTNSLPFYSDIQNFRKLDSLKPPKAGVILFVGSSSFRLWTQLETVFKDYNALNRGFGGATLIDVNRYANEVIFPYKPRQILIYCGENDLPSDTVSAEMLYGRFVTLYTTIRSKMPEVPIAYVSIKPSPARAKYLPIIRKANRYISRFLAKEPNAEFIDVFSPLLTKNGHLRPELYGNDRLHINAKGYEIWARVIEPYLIRNE